MRPLKRKSGLFAENLPDEVILYDKSNNKVHCLNKTAAAIWESCDGTRTEDDLAQIVVAKLGGPADRNVVLQALEDLEKADLLEPVHAVAQDAVLTSRREAVGKIALASSALVATIAAPPPKAHSSNRDPSPTPPPLGHHPK